MKFNKDFCEKFDIKYPIFQAGMGKTMGTPTTPELVYEVSNAGGVGFLGASGLTLEEIEKSCLLYTSPSPRDNKASRMPSSA